MDRKNLIIAMLGVIWIATVFGAIPYQIAKKKGMPILVALLIGIVVFIIAVFASIKSGLDIKHKRETILDKVIVYTTAPFSLFVE